MGRYKFISIGDGLVCRMGLGRYKFIDIGDKLWTFIQGGGGSRQQVPGELRLSGELSTDNIIIIVIMMKTISASGRI